MLERVDILTGGASTSYGSDAMSGAINFIMKRDFEGVALDADMSQTGEGDGDITTASLTLGTNMADGRGNIVLGVNWTDREGVQLGARPLGQLGIVTADGSGYDQFLAGEAPTPGPAGCGGPGSVEAGGSTTTLPTRVAIFGGSSLGSFQFREDKSLGGQLQRVQLQSVQLLPDAANALRWHGHRSLRSERARGSLWSPGLQQHHGAAAGRALRSVRYRSSGRRSPIR